MQPAAAGDGADNDPDDFNSFQNPYHDQFRRSHYINPFINPFYLHESEPPQLDVYGNDMPDPRGLPYPPTPSHHHYTDRPEVFRHTPETLDPISLSPLPLTKPNLGDYHPTFSLPVPSTDGPFTLPSAAEDRPTMTMQDSQAGPSRTIKKRQPKLRDDPFINYSAESLLRKGKKRAVKSFVSNEAPSADFAATGSSLPSTTAPSLPSSSSTAVVAVLPPILYDKGNSVHQQIVEITAQNILGDAVNVCSVLGDSDIKQLVRKTLATAVTSCCHDQTFGEEWAAANFEVLFESLSAPFELIVVTCKTLARAKVERGYHLRPSAWSCDSETNRKARKVNDLVNDHTSPLKFIFRKDEETDKSWPFEHEVVWDVVLGVIAQLKLQRHVKNLDNLFCTAAAAVHCALWELRNGKMVDIAFSASTYKHLYNQLMDYITNHIAPNQELATRWGDFKVCTVTRLEDII